MRSILLLTLGAALAMAPERADAALHQVTSFGSNPGGLAMYEYVPAGLPAGRPLVVVLHGCTQTAASMESAGWNALADQMKFAVVYAEQQTANNPVRCFNWAGEYGDTADLVRGQGENQSIISMVDTAIAAHGSDASKVYVVGFSAGAAFAAVMLATWPERFAAGAIMSGLPYRCATTVAGAYSCQSPGVDKTPAAWGDLVRAAHAYTGPRPRVQIWHGANDSTVVPMNEGELVDQWSNVFGIDTSAAQTEMIGSHTHTTYKQGSTVVLDVYRIAGMSHAVAIGADPLGACTGAAASYFEDRSICSTLRAARFFGLDGTGTSGGGSDVTAPAVAIVSPSDGSEASGQVTVVVAASDDTAMAGVTLTIDGAPVGDADTEPPYQFAWAATEPGAHTLVATATDAAGNHATATATITVPGAGGGSNPPPSGVGGGDDDGSPEPNQDLPGCGLDAGGGGAGIAMLLASVALLVSPRRRARNRGGAAGPR